MQTKNRKLLSLILALVMAISSLTACFTAFGANAYKPTYGEKATKQDFNDLIGDVNTLLDSELLTGDTIERLMKFLPSLDIVLQHQNEMGAMKDKSSQVPYYTPSASMPAQPIEGTPVEEVSVAEGISLSCSYFQYDQAEQTWKITTTQPVLAFTVIPDSSIYQITGIQVNGKDITVDDPSWATFNIYTADYDGEKSGNYIVVNSYEDVNSIVITAEKTESYTLDFTYDEENITFFGEVAPYNPTFAKDSDVQISFYRSSNPDLAIEKVIVNGTEYALGDSDDYVSFTADENEGTAQNFYINIKGAGFTDQDNISIEIVSSISEEPVDPEPTTGLPLTISGKGDTGNLTFQITPATYTGSEDISIIMQDMTGTDYTGYTATIKADLTAVGFGEMEVASGALTSFDSQGMASMGIFAYTIPADNSTLSLINQLIATGITVPFTVEITAPAAAQANAVLAAPMALADETSDETTGTPSSDYINEDGTVDIVGFFTDNDLMSYSYYGNIIDDVTDENGNVTEPGTFTKFFEDHPIVVENETEFAAWLNAIIDNYIVVDGLTQILQFLAPTSPEDAETNHAALDLADGLDEICAALGVEQENKAADILGFNTAITGAQADMDAVSQYIQNIVNKIFANGTAVENLVMIIVNAVQTDNLSALYRGVTGVLGSLNSIIDSIQSLGIDLSSIKDTITAIYDIFLDLPLVEGTTDQIDFSDPKTLILNVLQGVLNIAGVDISGAMSIIQSLLTVPAFDLNGKLGATEDAADAVKTVYDYLYSLLNANKSLLNLVNVELLESIGLDAETANTLYEIISNSTVMDNDSYAAYLLGLADQYLPDAPEDPDEPSTGEPSTGEPSTGEPSTGEPSTGEPSTDKPSTSDPTTGNDDESTTAGNGKLPVVDSSNPNLPNTGNSADYITAISAVVAILAALGLVYVVLYSKKKITE